MNSHDARNVSMHDTVFAFAGSALIAEGARLAVALKLKHEDKMAALQRGEILIFAADDGRQIDLHLSGEVADIERRYRPESVLVSAPDAAINEGAEEAAKRGRGRPKLGVVGREVTLLPRHWAWLESQRGGASATLRRLVESERKARVEIDAQRASQDRTNRFLSSIAGDLEGFEEATRALYARDRVGFEQAGSTWSRDIKRVAAKLSKAAFAELVSE